MNSLFKWRPGVLAWNTAHVTGWNLARALLQALSLILIARQFGASGYGGLAGAVALYTTIAQFVGMGSGVVLVRNGSRDQTLLPGELRTTQGLYLGTGLLAFLVAWPLSSLALPESMSVSMLGYLAAAELVAAPAMLPIIYAHQARERMGLFGFTLALAPLARLLAVLISLYLHANIEEFAKIYCATLFLTALLVVTSQLKLFGKPERSLKLTLRAGFPYAITGVASTAGSELDKTVLLRYEGSEIAGHYAAPYRVLQAAVLPVMSLALSAAPRLFRAASAGGIHGIYLPLVLLAALYATTAGAIIYFVAPLLPSVLGIEFTESVELLRWMLPLFFLNCIRQVLGTTLTGADFQWRRNALEAFSATASIAGLLILVPRYGTAGAITAVSVSELLFILLAIWILTRESEASPK